MVDAEMEYMQADPVTEATASKGTFQQRQVGGKNARSSTSIAATSANELLHSKERR